LRDIIYRRLKEANSYISGETISDELGVTRAALWKHIRAMAADGAVIDSVTRRGYKLVSPPNTPHPEYVSAHIHHDIPLYYKPVTTSTNDDAKAAARELQTGVFIAGQQTAGKGRKGRTWVSAPRDGIYMSFLVRPKTAPEQVACLTLAVAVAMCQAIEGLSEVSARIKWPNDIIVDGKKAAGILTESLLNMDGVDYVVCGIGINTRSLFEGELAGTATGISANGTLLAAAMIDAFLDAYDLFEKKGLSPFMDEFRRRSAISGTVSVSSSSGGETGELAGFDDDGALLLRVGSEVRRYVAGEVSLRGEHGYV
jgi:BirA family biotin operon repressor/biotin-[acetyl-CoA-carboxylase] ligase